MIYFVSHQLWCSAVMMLSACIRGKAWCFVLKCQLAESAVSCGNSSRSNMPSLSNIARIICLFNDSYLDTVLSDISLLSEGRFAVLQSRDTWQGEGILLVSLCFSPWFCFTFDCCSSLGSAKHQDVQRPLRTLSASIDRFGVYKMNTLVPSLWLYILPRAPRTPSNTFIRRHSSRTLVDLMLYSVI